MAESINFDSDKTCSVPAAWSAGVTGRGSPKWAVEPDATAPSKPNVLKQSGSGTFPYCVLKQSALADGYAAATIVAGAVEKAETDDLRLAFDGDAVLFSDEAERVYQERGLDAFAQSEMDAAREPLSGGPFKEFLAALHRIQADFPEDRSPIRTALVTARSAPAHERVIRTLRAWNIRIDEALFLGGLDKGEFLRAFRADIFFDDQRTHVDSARKHVAAGHVPHGVANEEKLPTR